MNLKEAKSLFEKQLSQTLQKFGFDSIMQKKMI